MHQKTEVQERQKVACLLRSYQGRTAALWPGAGGGWAVICMGVQSKNV